MIAVPANPLADRLPTLPQPAGSVVLWDSLFIRSLAQHPIARPGIRQGLLMHYLPFQDLLLTERERDGWRQAFLEAARPMRFFITTGADAALCLQRLVPDRPVWLCQPGVDARFIDCRAERTRPLPEGPVRILTVANILPAKRPLELLELLAGIDADWEWRMVGNPGIHPEYAARLRARLRALGLTDRVLLLGELPTPPLARLMAEMDLFVSYSAQETYGMALAEAVASGLPGVATAVGAATRLIQDGKTGFIAPVDDPGRFRQTLELLIRDRGLRLRFTAAAMNQLPRSWDVAFEDFARAIRQQSG